MKSLKNRWEQELELKIPALREDVLSAPIPVFEGTTEVSPVLKMPWYKRMFEELFASPKRFVPVLATCALALFTAGMSLFTLFSGHVGVISVEVNPQAVFSVDKDGIVTAVASVNQDADVVLSENRDEEMLGKTVEEAVTIFVDYTAKLGFLDLDTPDAVRVSSCEENEYLKNVGETLENYFLSKGAYVVVAQENMQLKDFCARTQMELASSIETLKNSVERIPVLCFERELEGKDVQELQENYRREVPAQGVKELLNASIDDGIKKVDTINEIFDLYEEILRHKDNPVRYDYWAWKDKAYPDTMSELMGNLEEKISLYSTKYGVQINSFLDIVSERAKCALIPLQILRDVLLDYTMDAFINNYESISKVLEFIGVDIEKFTSWYDPPTTLEGYVEKVKAYQKARYDLLKERNLHIFEKAREEISKNDYVDFLQEIITNYGSPSAYFQSLNEKN